MLDTHKHVLFSCRHLKSTTSVSTSSLPQTEGEPHHSEQQQQLKSLVSHGEPPSCCSSTPWESWTIGTAHRSHCSHQEHKTSNGCQIPSAPPGRQAAPSPHNPNRGQGYSWQPSSLRQRAPGPCSSPAPVARTAPQTSSEGLLL